MTELTDDELLIIWRFNFAKTDRRRFLDIARAAIAADRDLTAALAKPADGPAAVAERPSDEELGLIYHDCCRGCEFMDQVGFEDAARAVLARWGNHSADASTMVPPAEGPSDEELRDLWSWAAGQDQGPWPTQQHAFARAVLTRWGQPPAPPAEGEVAELVAALRIEAWAYGQLNTYREWAAKLARTAELLERHAAPVPVPVAERLPGPEDCDAEGYCWRWNTIAGSWARQPISRSWYEFETHWLPAHALPLPAPQGGEVQP